jgi:hypothetical protein
MDLNDLGLLHVGPDTDWQLRPPYCQGAVSPSAAAQLMP